MPAAEYRAYQSFFMRAPESLQTTAAMQALLWGLIAGFLREISFSLPKKLDQYRTVIEFINDHASAELFLARIAAVSGKSDSIISRELKQALGMPVKAYINT
ncbi:MAG TPA: hypothetical protein DC049_02070 [Spirochaetia bacterium]|nr:hypothetical protein [Spirochaetia bacterium]